MNKKFFNKKIAKRLMTIGVIGFVISIVISLATLFTVYSKVGNISFGDCTGMCKTDNFGWESITAHIGVVLEYASLATIVVGALTMIAASILIKKQNPALQVQPRTKHLVLRVLASIAAFFISNSIIAVLIANSILKASPKTADQPGHIVAYIFIFAYPLVGGFSAYFTNKYLKKRLAG